MLCPSGSMKGPELQNDRRRSLMAVVSATFESFGVSGLGFRASGFRGSGLRRGEALNPKP